MKMKPIGLVISTRNLSIANGAHSRMCDDVFRLCSEENIENTENNENTEY
jgi:hypothetical protein